jgi:DNA invertase Pin-like site-specific DNA recombinase
MIKAVAYARVSTLLKQDPEHQLVPIRQLAKNRDFQLADEFVDRITGSADRRKDLDRLLRDARLGKFKILISYSLDRLGRDTRFLLNLLHELEGYGVSVIFIRESIDLSTPIGKAVMQILGAIAELEKNLISERIKTALAVKKLASSQTGWRCGRKPLDPNLAVKARDLRAKGRSIRAIASELGISKTSVERILRGKR